MAASSSQPPVPSTMAESSAGPIYRTQNDTVRRQGQRDGDGVFTERGGTEAPPEHSIEARSEARRMPPPQSASNTPQFAVLRFRGLGGMFSFILFINC